MNDKPDFEALRGARDAGIEEIARQAYLKLGGNPDDPVTFHAREYGSPCYCDCGSGGPCEHEFSDWREFDDGCGGEQFCARCGEGAMAHSLRFLP